MKNSILEDLTILYVEDEELTRNSLERFLSKRVKQLHVAKNGKEGLELYREHNPDIVVTDIRMPIMDGLTMAKNIKEIRKEMPIIVTTAFNDENYFLEAIDIGIDKYVKKPVSTRLLFEALSSIGRNVTMQGALDKAQRKIEEQYLTMKEEMTMAALFQKRMMPKKDATAPNEDFDIAYYTYSYSAVSGDFLIIENLDKNHFGVLLIDVMGHGVAAGLVTIELKTIFEEIKKNSFSPATILQLINEKILSISDNVTFFTATYAIYNKKLNNITVSSAGGIPFIYFKGETEESEVCFIEGDPIGLFPKEEFTVSEKTFHMQSNDRLLMQTDGFIETFNEKEEKFDTFFSQEKFKAQIHRNGTSQEIIEGIIREVNLHKGEQHEFNDDATIIVFKKK